LVLAAGLSDLIEVVGRQCAEELNVGYCRRRRCLSSCGGMDILIDVYGAAG